MIVQNVPEYEPFLLRIKKEALRDEMLLTTISSNMGICFSSNLRNQPQKAQETKRIDEFHTITI